LHGERARLEALQQVALGKQEGAVSDWLRGQQLDTAPRLAEELDVEHGWERAMECVLGFNLEAVCVPGLEPLGDALGALREGSVTLFDTKASPPAPDNTVATPLMEKVRAPWRLDALLTGVYAVDSLSEALAMRGRLSAGESVVTRDGLWLGNGWLRVVRDADAKAGVLEREQELKTLIAALDEETDRLDQMQQRLEQDRERRRSLEAQREQSQAELNRSTRTHADLQSELSARRARLEQVQTRQARLEEELRETQALVERDTQEIGEARTRLQQAVEQISGFEQQRQSLEEQRGSLRSALEEARDAAQTDREAAQQLQLRAESLRTESGSLTQSMQRLETRLAQLMARHEELDTAIAEAEAPLAEMGSALETQLALRQIVEAELADARRKLETIDHTVRELEERRGSAEQAVQEAREALEQTRIASQEFKVRRQTLAESVAQSGFELETLLREMPNEASEEVWQEKVEGLERRVQRLGPINLAAIDEYEQESERKKYLDAQHEDLSEALDTLEGAIRKIDRETRTRFKETYDKVNSGLQGYFPRLFGGGHAYLEMTSDDLLETGVTVMARPPGKRNSTIHLLSGGEKALTAVALVYAIFQLNPAPFCLLDEVDAPLDDANVGRYCELLESMSDRTQFIFITHNKLTMEIAHQLTGVTMNEPGVSHLVAVDVDEAVELAAV
ncbi:MAG: chromosome segregation protein SMC, partial [Pseudomonadota bacterium]